MKRYVFGALLALLLALVLLAGFFPAAWAWHLVRGRVSGLHIAQVHGSVWNGDAEGVEYAGMPLGTVRWTLSRAAVFAHPDLRVDVDGALARGSGRLVRRGDAWIGEDMHVAVDAGQLPVTVGSPGMAPRGEVRFDIDRVEIQGDWPRQLHGTVAWRRAALADGVDTVALGDLHASVHERAGAVLEARLSDAGGPLALSGTVQVSTLGWRVDADLRARQADPGLRRVLAQMGTVAADGSLHLRRQGGLMMGEQP